MANNWRIFILLLWKNFTVRKRHWILSSLVQICIPVFLFALTQIIRDQSSVEFGNPYSEEEKNDRHFPIFTKEKLLAETSYYDYSLFFVPKNDFTEDLMERTRSCLMLPKERLKGFSSKDELMNSYISQKNNNSYFIRTMAVVFKNPERHNSALKHLEYIIRPEYFYYHGGMDNFVPFVQIQMCLDESFLQMKNPNSWFKNNISVQQMPIPANTIKLTSNNMMRIMYATIAVMALLIPLSIETTYPANEKTLGVNILMSMNGVKNYQNLLSWFISGLLFSIFYIIPRLILLNISFASRAKPFLYYGNTFLVALMHFVHIAHLLAFGYHVSSYFSKSFFRSLGIQLLYLGSFALQMYIGLHNVYTVVPYLGILFPNILLYRIYEEIDTYEKNLIGVGWSNLFLVGDMKYNATGSLGVMLIFSIIGTLLHFFLALYASSLFPGKYGVPKNPLFFLKFFKSKRVSSEEELHGGTYNMNGTPFEPVPKDVYVPGIQIRNLKKTYLTNCFSRAEKQALRGISIDFYEGQITTLLGHNGAGKTTMMSILTGLLSPTEGMVLINGKNIRNEMDQIVTDLGLCPQEDILFPDLNVFEQIQFFGLLKSKNKTDAQIKKDVTDLMQKLKITEKQNDMPANLSGGQKRRVCLGMAIIGDASTLILDEPTSGMDPETRRESWDILLKMRGEKTILISTHNMEEADVLGDRTAIIELGKLKSYGTPMFLKKFYGEGNMEVTLSTEEGCEVEKIRSQLTEESQLINFDGGKVVFSIPYNDQLPDDLDRIEEKKEELGVTGISVSLITLEQVFLRATKEDNEKSEEDNPRMEKIKKVEGRKHFLQSKMALFRKKFAYMQRNKITSLLMIIIPLISIFLISLTFNDSDNTSETPIQLNMYRDPEVLYSSNNEHYGKIYKTTVESSNGKATDVGNTNISEAILDYGTKDLAAYLNNLVAAATFEIGISQEINVNALFSDRILYSLPITFNLVSNAIIKALAGEEYQIDISNHKLPEIYNFRPISNQSIFDYVRVILLIICLFPTFALYVIHPLRESSCGIKELQRMTGVTSFLYWGTFFLFDFFVCMISMILLVIGLYCMDKSLDERQFYGTEIGIMVLLLTLLALNSLPFVYIFSFWRKKTTSVITILSILPLLVVGIESIIRVIIMVELENIEKILAIERRFFMLIPSVSFFYGQHSFFETANRNAVCRKMPKYYLDMICNQSREEECCELNCSDGVCEKSFEYFGDFKGNGSLEECILYLCLTPLIYFVILGLLENKIISKLFTKKHQRMPINNTVEIDDQVKAEKSSVASEISKLKKQGGPSEMQNPRGNMNGGYSISNADSENFSIYLAYELSKYYGNLPAVKEISFSVKKSECFGLLGVNGAGKSTTFRMLTGEEFPNSGIMYLNGKEISLNRKEYLAQMGYCPQNSALIKSLNSKDHLKLFASLRGVPTSQVSSEVEKWINRLNLNLCANQPSGTYSGGNKRRLSIALALIGNPNLVLLDEPTTGVDPAARRSLWHVIKSCQLAGQSIILTSHSMEECEALCNRLVIMVRGQFVCIGASEQLKQRFGAGYDINLKLNPERSNIDVENIKRDMTGALQCELRDEHVGYITYHVTDSKTKWKTMYGVMKSLKEKYSCIEDFSVLSATLEQLFLQFARADGKNVTVQVH